MNDRELRIRLAEAVAGHATNGTEARMIVDALYGFVAEGEPKFQTVAAGFGRVGSARPAFYTQEQPA